MATGENFMRINRNGKAKELQAKIYEVKAEMAALENINTINEKGWRAAKWMKLDTERDRLEYQLYCENYH
jgi:hypothetical protein